MRREPQENGMPVMCGVCVCSDMALHPTEGSHPPEVQGTLSWHVTSDFPSQALLLQSVLTLYKGVYDGLVETCAVWLNFFPSPNLKVWADWPEPGPPKYWMEGDPNRIYFLLHSCQQNYRGVLVHEPRETLSFLSLHHIPLLKGRAAVRGWGAGVRG